MGANHVAARLAFNNGVDVATAVVFRSAVSATVLAVIIRLQGVPFRFDALTPRQRRFVPLDRPADWFSEPDDLSSVARLPVALALLAFNTYLLCAAFWDRVLYGKRPDRSMLLAMPVILFGLALALDVAAQPPAWAPGRTGRRSALGLPLRWPPRCCSVAMILTQHEITALDGRVRSCTTLGMAGLVAIVSATVQGGLQFPSGATPDLGLARPRPFTFSTAPASR